MTNSAGTSEVTTGRHRPLSARAIAMLRCPVCRAAVERNTDRFQCLACHAAYPVVDNVPVMLDEHRSIFRSADFARARDNAKSSWSLKKAARRLLPRLEINFTGRASILRFKGKLLQQTSRPVVLNIGGKHASSFSTLVASGADVECIEAHLAFAPRTNLITDPHALPLADGSVDAVIVDAVLEHTVDPAAVVAEIVRVLKSDGLVYSDTPFMVQVHGGPFDFQRFSHLAHRRLFRRFTEIESGVSCGPASALAVSIQSFLLSFVRSPKGRAAVKGWCCLTLFWVKYFDYLLVDKPGALDAALGTYFVGQKAESDLDDRDLIKEYRGTTPPLYSVAPD